MKSRDCRVKECVSPVCDQHGLNLNSWIIFMQGIFVLKKNKGRKTRNAERHCWYLYLQEVWRNMDRPYSSSYNIYYLIIIFERFRCILVHSVEFVVQKWKLVSAGCQMENFSLCEIYLGYKFLLFSMHAFDKWNIILCWKVTMA